LLIFIEKNKEKLIKLYKEDSDMKDTIKSVEEIGYLDDEFFALEYDKEALDEQIKKESLENALKDGIEKGSHEEKITIAKKLLNKNLSLDEISEITGLSTEDISNLLD
jgi:predicted transposase/invertase (TIGR01784 family)